MRPITILSMSVLIILLSLIGWQAYQWSGQSAGQSFMSIGQPFELASSKGGTLSNAALKGTPYAVFFGFTHCPEVCPTTLADMDSALKAMGDQGKDLRVLFITVDPERDTVAKMKDYVSNFDPRIEALVPTAQQLPSLARAFKVFYEKVPGSAGEYTMNHTASVLLFDRQGEFVGTLAYGEEPEVRLQKLQNLMKG